MPILGKQVVMLEVIPGDESIKKIEVCPVKIGDKKFLEILVEKRREIDRMTAEQWIEKHCIEI